MKPETTDSPIVIEDLHKSFGEQKVLNGIDLVVNSGEALAVLGRSGTGKMLHSTAKANRMLGANIQPAFVRDGLRRGERSTPKAFASRLFDNPTSN